MSDVFAQIQCTMESSKDNSRKVVVEERPNGAWYDLANEINDLEDNTDVIPKSESEHRLNILFAGIALILLSFAMTLTYLCFQMTKPIIIEYEYPIMKKALGIPHLMMITNKGQMVPYAWKSKQQTNASYPNLSKKIYKNCMGSNCEILENYFLGYFYDHQINVVYPDSNQKMVVIEKNGTHRMLSPQQGQIRDAVELPIHGLTLVHLNNFAWILGGYTDKLGDRRAATTTRIWSTRKQHWFKGPSMPTNFFIFHGCIVAVNRTVVFLIGGSDSDLCMLHCKNRFVMSYDFEQNTWSNLPDVPLQSSEMLNEVTCTTNFNKMGQAFVFALSTKYDLHDYGYHYKPGLFTSLDLETYHWKIEGTFDIGLGYLANLQGILHYFISSQALGFYWDTQNLDFKPIRENMSQYQIESDLQAKSPTISCYL